MTAVFIGVAWICVAIALCAPVGRFCGTNDRTPPPEPELVPATEPGWWLCPDGCYRSDADTVRWLIDQQLLALADDEVDARFDEIRAQLEAQP